MPTTTIAAGTTCQPIAAPNGALVNVTPAAKARALVEYSPSTLASIQNGVGVWFQWARGSTIQAIQDRLGDNVFLRVTAIGGAVTLDINENPSALDLIPYQQDWRILAGDINNPNLAIANVNIPLSLTNPRARMVFLGDSLTYGGAPGRAPGIFDGRPWYGQTTITTPANVGSGNWINYAMVDGRAGTAGGTLSTDATGRVRWAYSGDTAGPYVDVSEGGFYYLPSGTVANSGIFIAVRGATAPSLNASTGVTTTGLATISEYNLIGYVPFVAGALGDTFADYQAYGITGATTADLVKFAPQALATDVEAVCILIGVNDSPTTAALAATAIANIKTVIDLARAKARRVYVNEIAPNPSATATVVKFLTLVSEAIRTYCRTLRNVRFVSAFDRMVNPNAIALGAGSGGKTGAYHTDNLHFMPFGAYLFAKPLTDAILLDYPRESPHRCTTNVWDTTLLVGALNANPALRGVAGTVTAAVGITGTAPDSWTLNRSGATQTCTTSFVAAVDGGLDWWCMDVAGATGGDYHELSQIVALPAGIATGDYFQLVGEFQIFAEGTPGLAILQAQATSNGNTQSGYLFQLGRNVDTFTTELPVLHLRGEPQKLLAGVTTFTMRIRIGAGVGGTGKAGFRKFRIEKCAGPIYP